jgi:very-short-patch-repair endonuclease
MNPHLKRQITFGTGKGGLKKWLTKKFTVDFYDEKNKIAYEIDGKSHRTKMGWVNDRLKDHFMKEKGILVIHYTNEQVERAYNEWSKNAKEIFSEFFSNAI